MGRGGERGCIGWSMPWKERHGVGDGSEFAWLGSGSIFLSCSTFFFTLSLSDGPRRAAFGRRKFTTGMMMIVGLSGVGR